MANHGGQGKSLKNHLRQSALKDGGGRKLVDGADKLNFVFHLLTNKKFEVK